MRMDFSNQQYRGSDDQRLVRLMRAARAAVGTLFVVAMAVVVFKSPPPAADPAPAVASAIELEIGPQSADTEPQRTTEPIR